MTKKLKVLLVEDSPVDQMLLAHILNSDSRLQVIGMADSGAKAIAFNERFDPDVIVMDVTMANMDGLETTARIMQSKPVPIVVCTGLHATDPTVSFRAIEAGALAMIGKPEGPEHKDYHALARSLTDTVVLMSEVRVIRRWPRFRPDRRAVPEKANSVAPRPKAPVKLIAIGASTGGPPVLQTLLARLPLDLPMPLLIVQHIAPGFLHGMVSWLQLTTGFPVRIAQHNARPLPGHAYLAPDSRHLGVNAAGTLVLSGEAPVNGLRPAVSHLFRSLAATSFAAEVVAVLLTGMGSDGAVELKALKDLGAITIAQDAESAVVHGMPGEAIRLGGVSLVLSPNNIAFTLCQLAGNKVPRMEGVLS
jgi:two-component system chemotaxis response regulator CheB